MCLLIELQNTLKEEQNITLLTEEDVKQITLFGQGKTPQNINGVVDYKLHQFHDIRDKAFCQIIKVLRINYDTKTWEKLEIINSFNNSGISISTFNAKETILDKRKTIEMNVDLEEGEIEKPQNIKRLKIIDDLPKKCKFIFEKQQKHRKKHYKSGDICEEFVEKDGYCETHFNIIGRIKRYEKLIQMETKLAQMEYNFSQMINVLESNTRTISILNEKIRKLENKQS